MHYRSSRLLLPLRSPEQGLVAKSGPPKLAERRTRVIILTQLNVPNFRFFVGKKRSNASFCIVPFAGPNKKIERRNVTAFVWQKSAAPSADRALRHRGCTIEVPGSCFPHDRQNRAPLRNRGRGNSRKRLTRVIILIQSNFRRPKTKILGAVNRREFQRSFPR
jgi:hypothetical protein